MIDTLSAEELDQLEAILGKPLDEKTELQMIQAELQQLGMDPQDVHHLFNLLLNVSFHHFIHQPITDLCRF